MPGGAFITQALDNHGVINKAAAWVEQKIATLGDIGGGIAGASKQFLDFAQLDRHLRSRRRVGARQAHLHRADLAPDRVRRRLVGGILEDGQGRDPQAARGAGRRARAATTCCE